MLLGARTFFDNTLTVYPAVDNLKSITSLALGGIVCKLMTRMIDAVIPDADKPQDDEVREQLVRRAFRVLS